MGYSVFQVASFQAFMRYLPSSSDNRVNWKNLFTEPPTMPVLVAPFGPCVATMRPGLPVTVVLAS